MGTEPEYVTHKYKEERKKAQRRQDKLDARFPKICYKDYLDKATFHFTSAKPVGIGAIDLTEFKLGHKPSRPPTSADIVTLNNEDFFPIQTRFDESLKHFTSLAQTELENLWKSIAPENLSEHSLFNKPRRVRVAKTLAALTNVYLVKYICWIPDRDIDGDKLLNKDNTLMGKYVCRYQEQQADNTTVLKDITVGTHWAEMNFSVVALAYAQRLGYEVSQKLSYTDNDGNLLTTKGFLNIEVENVLVEMDEVQFNRIRYIPILPIADSPEGEMLPEKWLAYRNDTEKQFEVAYDYLVTFLSVSFLDEVRRAGLDNDRAFIDIPPGEYKSHVEYPHELEKGPPIHYFQTADS